MKLSHSNSQLAVGGGGWGLRVQGLAFVMIADMAVINIHVLLYQFVPSSLFHAWSAHTLGEVTDSQGRGCLGQQSKVETRVKALKNP